MCSHSAARRLAPATSLVHPRLIPWGAYAGPSAQAGFAESDMPLRQLRNRARPDPTLEHPASDIIRQYRCSILLHAGIANDTDSESCFQFGVRVCAARAAERQSATARFDRTPPRPSLSMMMTTTVLGSRSRHLGRDRQAGVHRHHRNGDIWMTRRPGQRERVAANSITPVGGCRRLFLIPAIRVAGLSLATTRGGRFSVARALGQRISRIRRRTGFRSCRLGSAVGHGRRCLSRGLSVPAPPSVARSECRLNRGAGPAGIIRCWLLVVGVNHLRVVDPW